jgi:ribonuclease P protein component
MLPRRKRLSRQGFSETARGKSVTSKHLTLVFGTSEAGGCAAVVSKKVAKRSVDRHLLKRRILECMREKCSSSRYLVVYAKTGSPKLSFKDLSAELSELFSRIR